MGLEYASAIPIILNKTKFEHTKENFISEGLLKIWKWYVLSLTTIVHS